MRDWAVSVYSGILLKTWKDKESLSKSIFIWTECSPEADPVTHGQREEDWERGLLRLLYLKVRSHKADHSDSLTLTEVKRCHRHTHTRTHTFEDSHWRQRDESTKQPQKLSHVTCRNSTDLQISLSVCFTAPCNSLSGDCKDRNHLHQLSQLLTKHSEK